MFGRSFVYPILRYHRPQYMSNKKNAQSFFFEQITILTSCVAFELAEPYAKIVFL